MYRLIPPLLKAMKTPILRHSLKNNDYVKGAALAGFGGLLAVLSVAFAGTGFFKLATGAPSLVVQVSFGGTVVCGGLAALFFYLEQRMSLRYCRWLTQDESFQLIQSDDLFFDERCAHLYRALPEDHRTPQAILDLADSIEESAAARPLPKGTKDVRAILLFVVTVSAGPILEKLFPGSSGWKSLVELLFVTFVLCTAALAAIGIWEDTRSPRGRLPKYLRAVARAKRSGRRLEPLLDETGKPRRALRAAKDDQPRAPAA